MAQLNIEIKRLVTKKERLEQFINDLTKNQLNLLISFLAHINNLSLNDKIFYMWLIDECIKFKMSEYVFNVWSKRYNKGSDNKNGSN